VQARAGFAEGRSRRDNSPLAYERHGEELVSRLRGSSCWFNSIWCAEFLDRSASAARPAGWALALWRLITLECWLRGQATDDLPQHLRHLIDACTGSYDFVEVGGE
jgi:hypothetical protein